LTVTNPGYVIWEPCPYIPPTVGVAYVQPSPIYIGYPYKDPELVELLKKLTLLLEELTKMLKERNHTLLRDKP
jgi:hypothetical protein